MARLKKGQCVAGPYRIFGFLTIFFTNVICLFLLHYAPSLHPKEKGLVSGQEADAVAFSVFITFFLPCIFLFGLYFTTKGWERTRGEVIYRCQAWVSLALIAVICLFAILNLGQIVLYANYLEPVGPEGFQPANPQPFELSLSGRAQRLFLYLGVFLVLVFSMGLIVPNPEQQKPAAPGP